MEEVETAMTDPLVSLAVSGLLVMAALWVISRLTPDEYDRAIPARVRSSRGRAED